MVFLANYEYNADGLRTNKTANGKTEKYYYNGTKLAYITDGSNNLKYYFMRDASGRLLNMVDYTGASPQAYWYLFDGHGSVIGLADNGGNQVATYEYDAWGNTTTASGSQTLGNGELLREANPFRYSGYQYDSETGFYYLKSRYYNSELGRFITRDTVPSSNLYAYCENNPVMFIDPSGHVFEILADVVSVGYSTYQLLKNPGWINAGYLLWDLGASALPFIPGSYAGKIGKATRHIDLQWLGKGMSKFVNVNHKIILNTATQAKKGGETVIGHALQKHAGRNPQIWGKVKGRPDQINQTALNHLHEILDGSGGFSKVKNSRGIEFLEKRLPDGRGVRLNLDGTFKGFID